ncbi:hypothetical protein D3C78_930920 [compost metagenome]
MAERFVELGTTGETEHIRDDRVFGQGFEGEFGQLGQRVALRHDHATVPAIARHHHQVAKQLQSFGGNGKIHGAVCSHFSNLHGRTLMHVQRHFRILLNEAADHWRQRITRLGVGGGDRQGALFLVGEFLGNLLDAFHLAQDLAGSGDDTLTRRGHTGQMLAAAGEHFNAQFVLKQADLLTDTRLGGVQTLRCRRDVEVVVRHFPDVAQLLKLHRYPSNQLGVTGSSDDL